MKTITQTYHIKAPVSTVWAALTQPKHIANWGAGPVTMSEKEGEPFSLWGGDIHGTTTKIIKETELHQDWYAGDWPQPSKLVFTLSEKAGVTTVKLVHTHVPDSEAPGIKDGWKDYYMDPLTDYVEKLV